MGEQLPARRFGKYVLLDRLNKGGMAEVYLAKMSGAESFERLLAIKCMRPEMVEDKQFSDMFIDEANLAGQLSHANIAQIYELGRNQDQLYIAMELVQGRDIRSILERIEERHEKLPLAFAVYVICKAAEGLDYAHRKVGKDGTPLNLVHRDVTPRNILVSFEGEVKLVDFGIAKASQRQSHTMVGQLKGKFGYLAPEQLERAEVDHRADIFTLGSVLFEMASGEKLYDTSADYDALERVREAILPDFDVVLKDAPKELTEVLLRALQREPDERYQFASELAKGLEPLLIEDRSIFGAREAGEYMQKIYLEEVEAERERTRELLSRADPGADSGEFKSPTETFFTTSQTTDELPRLPKSDRPSNATPTVPGRRALGELGGGYRETDEVDLRYQVTEKSPGRQRVKSGSAEPAAEPPPPEETGAGSTPWIVGGIIVLIAIAIGMGVGLIFPEGAPEGTETSPPVDGDTESASKQKVKPKPKPKPKVKPKAVTHGYVTIKVRGAKKPAIWVDKKMVAKASSYTAKLKLGTHLIAAEDRRTKKAKKTKVKVSRKHTRRAPATVVLSF